MKDLNKIFIIGGHSKKDPGAIALDGTTEREIIEGICSYISETFLVQKIGLNKSLTLEEKTKLINNLCIDNDFNYKNSILVSIHVDYYKASSGVMAYYYDDYLPSKQLADKVAKNVAKATKTPFKYLKPDTASMHGRLGIVRDTKPLACLVEVGSLGDDLEMLKNHQKQKEIANAIMEGIYEFAGVSEKIEIETETDLLDDIENEIKANSEIWMKLEEMQADLHKRNKNLRKLRDELS